MSASEDLNLSMFRAYDIRTQAARLAPALVSRLAAALAVYQKEELGARGVVVGHDARSSGPGNMQIGVAEFRAAGLDVVVLPGVSSTSHLYYAAMSWPEHAAVMFGASHNPAGDTGMKVLGPGVQPIAQGIGPNGGLDRIQQLYMKGARQQAARPGSIRGVDLMADYLAYSMALAGVEPGSLDGLPLLADFLNGAAGREFMLAFDRAGAKLEPLHYEPDGAFPLGDPNPVKQAVIREGIETLKKGGFRLAYFLDGDGDRLDVYRGDAAYLSSSFVYAAILPEIRQRFPGSNLGVFADLKCNPLAVIEMARCGLSVDVIRNGHSQIKAAIQGDPARFGCVEESAHFYEAFSHGGKGRYCTENTLYLALLIARVWKQDPARFDRLLEIQATTAREREWGYKFPTDQARDEALDGVRQHFEAAGATAMQRMRNGMDLEGTLLRHGLPFDVDQDTRLAADWLQLSQRSSQSEDRLARWEAVGATPERVAAAKREVGRIVAEFGAGEEYQG